MIGVLWMIGLLCLVVVFPWLLFLPITYGMFAAALHRMQQSDLDDTVL